jgi:hypothetical protein
MKNNNYKKGWMILLGLAFILSTTLTSCASCNNKPPEGKTAEAEEEAFPITDEMLKAVEDAIADPGKGKEFRFLLQVLQDLKAKKQVDINATNPQGFNGNPPSGETALHYAAQLPHINVVKALVQRKANINVKNNYQTTPLMNAASSGHTEVVKFLLEQPGINVNADEHGQTALYKAAERGHKEIVLLLLNYPGRDINKAYNDSNTLRTARSIAQLEYDTAGGPDRAKKQAVYQEIIQELANRGCNP